MLRPFAHLILLGALCERRAAGGVLDSIKSGFNNAKNDVEGALGFSQAPAPAGLFSCL